jgi:hypothetical protein
MEKLLFEGNRVTNNDPPQDDRTCDCCRKHVSELKPSGKAGDPLVGDFDGALLFRDHRSNFPSLEEAEMIIDLFFNGPDDAEAREDAKSRFIETFGKEDAGFITMTCGVFSCIGSVMLCRDCIVLDYDDYFDKLFEAYGHEELPIQVMRAYAKSLYEKCKQKYPVPCSQIEENRAKERVAWLTSQGHD